jgi:diketogulonate reductase-like aldo/keto reductase
MEIFDFELTEADMKTINGLNKDARFYDRVPTAEYSFIPITV